jgi:hypothetical protein
MRVTVWIAPSNADHLLPLLAQPLALGRLGIAPVVVLVPPSKHDLTRRHVSVDVEIDGSGRTRDPTASLGPAAVAQHEVGGSVLSPAVVTPESLVDRGLRSIQPQLLRFIRRIDQRLVDQRQLPEIAGRNP